MKPQCVTVIDDSSLSPTSRRGGSRSWAVVAVVVVEQATALTAKVN